MLCLLVLSFGFRVFSLVFTRVGIIWEAAESASASPIWIVRAFHGVAVAVPMHRDLLPVWMPVDAPHGQQTAAARATHSNVIATDSATSSSSKCYAPRFAPPRSSPGIPPGSATRRR